MQDLFLHIISASDAKSVGSKFYFTGIPCIRGHLCAKRTVNSTCVECELEKMQMRCLMKREAHRASLDDLAISASIESKFLHGISREDAISAGLLKYFTGRPCHRGHIDERYVSGFACIACSKDKIESSKDDKREYDRAHREKNADRYLEKAKLWAEANPEKVRETKRRWAKRNPDHAVAQQHRRRAMKKSAGGTYGPKDIARIFEMQRGKCAMCLKKICKSGKNKYHVDHVMPLALGGSNWPSNLQLLCAGCNLKKGAKHPIDFAKENGRLL